MRFKEFLINPHILQFRPFPHTNGEAVKVIYFRAFHGKQKRRMGGDYKLAPEEPRGILDEARKLNLPLGRKAVFRFVQYEQPVFRDFLDEIFIRALPV